MSLIKPENLKRIAEYMGYDCMIIGDSVQYAPAGCRGYVSTYDPRYNPGQLLELIEKVRPHISPYFSQTKAVIVKEFPEMNIEAVENTLAEAVIKAVLAMIGEKL